MELSEKFEKYLKEKGVNLKENEAKVSFTVSDMPLDWFIKFKENAKQRFGDCYWCYIMHLMSVEEKTATKEDYMSLLNEIQRLKERVTTLEDKVKVEKDPDAPLTLGGGD